MIMMTKCSRPSSIARLLAISAMQLWLWRYITQRTTQIQPMLVNVESSFKSRSELAAKGTTKQLEFDTLSQHNHCFACSIFMFTSHWAHKKDKVALLKRYPLRLTASVNYSDTPQVVLTTIRLQKKQIKAAPQCCTCLKEGNYLKSNNSCPQRDWTTLISLFWKKIKK